MHNLYESIDWLSIKLLGAGVTLLAIGGTLLSILSGLAFVSTIAYNCIRIYKDTKKKK
jgi:hypothetical protein